MLSAPVPLAVPHTPLFWPAQVQVTPISCGGTVFADDGADNRNRTVVAGHDRVRNRVPSPPQRWGWSRDLQVGVDDAVGDLGDDEGPISGLTPWPESCNYRY